MKKKRFITLLEIMIVIFLIALIGGVVGYNMRGSLEEGKVFKTRYASNQLKDLLLLEVAKGAMIEDVAANPELYLERSGLAKNNKNLLSDGWGNPFKISVTKEGDLAIQSDALEKYEKKQKKKITTPEEEQR